MVAAARAAAETTVPTTTLRAEFERSYGFDFDDFQRRACAALEGGSSVLVAAPTGAGKTVVGEFAAWLALKRSTKTFYTTPVKALSNQKYGDFVGLHGPSNVGLLTGDNSLNGDAPVVVMTTEVLRNMIYEDSPTLLDLRYVVLDEVHYLQDPYRGAVWEEILIHLPVDVQIVSLSATVTNAEEFAEWIRTLRGETEVIIEDRRPVEIRHWYFASDELLPMFVTKPRGAASAGPQTDGTVMPNPRGRELDRRRRHRDDARPTRGGRRVREKRARIPWRSEVVERLRGEKMLPAIYFIFSRKGCDEAVKQCLRDHLRLTTPDERRQILEYADTRVADLSVEELAVLGYDDWIAGLAEGISAHHAGMIPPFKETVEELFARGLVKVVFATETLALGINMPARTVVVESLTKFTGEKHELMTPGQYTQLSGRAGRRGIDELGHSVVLLQRFLPFEAVSRLASTRTYPLVSSFRPSYNMAVNLVRNYERADAEHLVNSSFAQFQADRDVVEIERLKEKNEAYLASYKERMACELGDFAEYAALLDKLRRLEKKGSRGSKGVLEAIASLKPGDVIEVSSGKRRGRYAVLEVAQRKSEKRPRVLALAESRSLLRLAPTDFSEPPIAVGKLPLPPNWHVRDYRARRQLALLLTQANAPAPPAPRTKTPGTSKEMRALAAAVESHPCHKCPEINRHLHYAARAERLQKELAGIKRRIRARTGTLARRFEKVLEVLEEFGHVSHWALTTKGEILTRIYNESDLLVAEALQTGIFDGLHPDELAALCSTLVYETRGGDARPVSEMPTPAVDDAWRRLMKLFVSVRRREETRGLDLTREPDPGFADRAYRWAAGAPLDLVLGEEDAPGDFVRSTKQLVDLLRQLEEVASAPELAERVRTAIRGLHRGVVAYSSVV